MKKKSRKQKQIKPKVFIRAWELGSSLEEVSKKLGLNIYWLMKKAKFYRRAGILLKKYPGRWALNGKRFEAYRLSLTKGTRKRKK